MSNNEKLPSKITSHLEFKCHTITKKFKENSTYDAGYLSGYEHGYEKAAIDAAYLLHEVFQKHESGLLPDRFVYDKIKKFLYGE